MGLRGLEIGLFEPTPAPAACSAHAWLGARARDGSARRLVVAPLLGVALVFLEGLREPPAALAEQGAASALQARVGSVGRALVALEDLRRHRTLLAL